MWVKNGIIPLLDFSPFDWTCLDSNVILINLKTVPNHWNHFKGSCSKICKIGQNTWEGACQFSYSCKVFPLLYLSKVEGQFRVRWGLEMVSHHWVKLEMHRTQIWWVWLGVTYAFMHMWHLIFNLTRLDPIDVGEWWNGI
jgi:hypothetical protein